jgi:hypothetical protein
MRFSKNFLTLWIPLKEGIGGEREGDFMDNFNECKKKNLIFFFAWKIFGLDG